MCQHDLSEIDLSTAGTRLRLRRGPKTVAAPAPAAAPTAAPPLAAEPPRSAKKYLEIKSEGPGTFYAKPDPQAEPYVKVGATVTPTTVVGKIGAMKIFTDV